MSGLILGGIQVEVEGVRILNASDDPRAKHSPEDYAKRTQVVTQLGIHTTQGKWPQAILPGRGPEGRAFDVAKYWDDDPLRSAAPIVIDGHVALCLGDLLTTAAHHATKSNPRSIGFEICQSPNGAVYLESLRMMLLIARKLCELSFDDRFAHALAVPYQIVGDAYVPGKIVERLKHGGEDWAGIFGHRDQAWMFPEWLDAAKRAKYPHGYAGRGRGDPGDEPYRLLIEDGCEPFKLGAREDLVAWMRRQAKLNTWGAKLVVDGIFGRKTRDAMKRFGFAHGREIDAAVEDPRNA